MILNYVSIVCVTAITSTVCMAQHSMVCNKFIQISLTEECEAIITPSQIIKNFDPYAIYSMEVTSSDGHIVEDNRVTVDHIGEQFDVVIKNEQTNISCWSSVLVESKIFPEFSGCGDLTISCATFPDTLDHMIQPEMGTGQCGTYSISYEDNIIEQQCSEDGYSHIVYRTWILVNQSNFTYTCEQRIFVKRQSLADLYFPPHFNDKDYKAISCDYELYADGHISYPHSFELTDNLSPAIKSYPYGTGSPGGEHCQNIKVNFNDTHYPSCGNQIKILRKWNIIDWCTGEDKVQDQVIEIIDDRGPVLSYKGHYETVDADFDDCYATIKSVPFPIDIHDCSDTEYTLAYKYYHDNGHLSEVITTGISQNEDGSFRITDIPLDTMTVIYIVTDDCGHSTRKEIEFKLHDTKPPVAVCQSRSVVTLVEGGYVTLAADKLQHQSFDNCAIVKQLIKRIGTTCDSHQSDLDYGEEISFCCTDSGDVNHKVSLRLIDAHGNYSDCQTEIVVQDKIKPVIVACAPHQDIHCLEDYSDIEKMGGEPETYDNCHMTMSYEDDDSQLNSCGFGKIYRTWKASDDHGNWSNCIQEINIINEFAVGSNDIVWPRPKTLTECVDADYSPSRLGEPHIPYQHCSNFTFNHEDQIFYDGAEECMKILRHWTVIDWCKYDPGAEFSAGYWTQTQSIRLSDSTKPIFQNTCDTVDVETTGNDCEVLVELDVSAIDDCSIHDLNYSYTVKYEGQGDERHEGASASILFSPGQHAVLFQVSDGCGNTDDCEFQIKVKENNSLHLICLQKLSISLGATGETEIWASDFIKEANTPCQQETTLDYSFTQDMSASFLQFNCEDFLETDGTTLVTTLTVYGLDENNHRGSCTVEITLTDNFNLCEDQMTSSALITGKIVTEDLAPISHKMVFLEDMHESTMRQMLTTGTGDYSFSGVDQSHEYKLDIESSGNAVEGVSTLDLIAIQKHILAQEVLDSPYKVIAADVDNSLSVSVSDLIYLRKLILGLETELPNQEVWKFIDATHVFMDDSQPWNYADEHHVRAISDDMIKTDFIALKLGDVNNSHIQAENRSNPQTAVTIMANKAPGDLINYTLINNNSDNIDGFQLSVKYDQQDMILHSIRDNNGIKMGQEYYTDHAGLVTISWNKLSTELIDSQTGFVTLRFKQKHEGFNEINQFPVTLNQEFQNEIYSTSGIVTKITDLSQKDGQGFLIKNAFPNPFRSNTNISFNTVYPTQVYITVYSATGDVLFSDEFLSKGGVENHTIDLNHVNQKGILYCKIETDKHQDIKQLIRLDN